MEASKYARQQPTPNTTPPRRESSALKAGLSNSKYADSEPAEPETQSDPAFDVESTQRGETLTPPTTEPDQSDLKFDQNDEEAAIVSTTPFWETVNTTRETTVEAAVLPQSEDASPPPANVETTNPASETLEMNNTQTDASSSSVPQILKVPTPEVLQRTDTPALAARGIKKFRSSKGKIIWVKFAADAAQIYGALRPLTTEQVNARMAKFQEAGYDTSGFDRWHAVDENILENEDAQNRSVYPDPTDLETERKTRPPGISVPDRKTWDDYVKNLTEERLRALGVFTADDTASSPLSRQGASPGPALPMSPPGLSSSAASQHQWQNAPPFSAPFSPATSTNNTSIGGAISPAPSLGQSQRPSGLTRQSTYGFPTQGPQFSGNGQSPASFQQFVPERGFTPQNVSSRGTSAAGLQRLPSAFSHNSPDIFVDRQQTPRAQSAEVRTSDNIVNPTLQMASGREDLVDTAVPNDANETVSVSEGKIFTELAYPTPRGHQHNISQNLEREVENEQYYPGEYIDEEDIQPKTHRGSSSVGPASPQEVQPYHRPMQSVASTASSSTRLNVEAEEFKFNPGASHERSFSKSAFMPAQAKPMVPKTNEALNPALSFAVAEGNRGFDHTSNFNVNAPSFKPPGQGSFSFSRPGFDFSANRLEDNKSVQNNVAAPTSHEKGPSVGSRIFGGLNLSDIVKPSKKSKAIPIVNPNETSDTRAEGDENDENFDEDGRIVQDDSRRKRGRFAADDGDEVPQFASPSPQPDVGGPEEQVPQQQPENPALDYDEPKDNVLEESVEQKSLAGADRASSEVEAESEIPWHEFDATSPRKLTAEADDSNAQEMTELVDTTVPDEKEIPDRGSPPYPSDSNDINNDATLYPTFQEIDAVMEHINSENLDNSDFGVEPPKPAKYVPPQLRKASWDVQQSTFRGVENQGEPPEEPVHDSSVAPEEPLEVEPEEEEEQEEQEVEMGQSDERETDLHLQHDIVSEQSPVRKLNTFDDTPVSDWDDMLPPGEELRIPNRSPFGDPHLSSLIESILRRRLDPFERTLKDVTSSMKRMSSRDMKDSRPVSSYTKSSSDADDEDTDTAPHSRAPRNKGDKKLEHIKAAVLEAMNANQYQGLGQIEQEVKYRKSAEDRADNLQRSLQLSEKEITLLKESLEDNEEKLRSTEEERDDWKHRHGAVEEELRTKTLDFTTENAALEDTLEEYRASSNHWRSEIESLKQARDSLDATVETLRKEAVEHEQARGAVNETLEKMKEDMSSVSNNLNVERSAWEKKDREHSRKYELLNARFEEEQRIKSKLGAEIERLSEREKEAIRANVMLEEAQNAKIRFEEQLNKLQLESLEHRSVVARFEQELQDAKNNVPSETQRVKSGLEAELEIANKNTENVRADLETRLQIAKADTETSKKDAESLKTRYESLMEEAASSRKKALQEASEASNNKVQEERQRFERSLQDMSAQHERALRNALEEKQRSDTHNNEMIKLANSRTDHLNDKIRHLEDKLSVAQSAAQAAVQAAQSAKSSPVQKPVGFPSEQLSGVSPKALRESVIVLQEQLQEREARIESLENQLSGSSKGDALGQVVDRDTEVGWLRELLGVRLDDLYELIDALSKPDFDRITARDAAIRIRANIQMEQQDRDRILSAGGSLGPGMNSISMAALKAANATQNLNVPSLADIQNFASPKAAQLAAAWGNWRSRARGEITSPTASLESLREAINSATPSRPNSTPSMNLAHQFGADSEQAMGGAASHPPISLSGLMTPPASNLRKTPTPPSQQQPQSPEATHMDESASFRTPTRPKSSRVDDEETSYPPTTPPLMRKGYYDQDAAAVTEIRADE